MTDQYTAFLHQAESLPDLVAGSTLDIHDKLRKVLSTEEVHGLREVVFTGSGDSLFAAQAATLALRQLSGLPVLALPAMEAARYIDTGHLSHFKRPRGLLLVSISSSGEAARVVEATRRLGVAGALTVGVTANPESRLGQAAERIIDIAIPPAPSAPGTRSYVASLIGSLGLSIRIAELLMTITMDQANALRGEMQGLSDAIAEANAGIRAIAADPGFDWTGIHALDCLGSGPSLVSARFLAAKLVEAAGLHAVAQCAEEFHHVNFFVDRPAENPAILFAPAMAHAASRQRELADTLGQLGRPSLVLTDDAELADKPGRVAIPPVTELFAPLLHCGPAAILAAEAAKARGVPHYRGHTGPWRGAQGAGLVRNSTILKLGEEG